MSGMTAFTEDQLYELLLSEEDCVPEIDKSSESLNTADTDGSFRIELGQPGQTAQDIVSQLAQVERRQPALVSIRITGRSPRPDRETRHQAMASRVCGVVRLICPQCNVISEKTT